MAALWPFLDTKHCVFTRTFVRTTHFRPFGYDHSSSSDRQNYLRPFICLTHVQPLPCPARCPTVPFYLRGYSCFFYCTFSICGITACRASHIRYGIYAFQRTRGHYWKFFVFGRRLLHIEQVNIGNVAFESSKRRYLTVSFGIFQWCTEEDFVPIRSTVVELVGFSSV